MSQIPPPQQPYQAPPGAPAVEPHRGVLILILGILSLTVCGLLAPFAWIMGNTDLQKIQAGQMDPSGEGLTQGGRICGMIGSIFLILGVVVGIIAMLFAVIVPSMQH
ncbi:MAG: DUF4190 domain-containing protein [Anaerolineaceae bacterium]|nr:DUF4190 domain-containing protein [Anaerolineaceae bacterium]